MIQFKNVNKILNAKRLIKEFAYKGKPISLYRRSNKWNFISRRLCRVQYKNSMKWTTLQEYFFQLDYHSALKKWYRASWTCNCYWICNLETSVLRNIKRDSLNDMTKFPTCEIEQATQWQSIQLPYTTLKWCFILVC